MKKREIKAKRPWKRIHPVRIHIAQEVFFH